MEIVSKCYLGGDMDAELKIIETVDNAASHNEPCRTFKHMQTHVLHMQNVPCQLISTTSKDYFTSLLHQERYKL